MMLQTYTRTRSDQHLISFVPSRPQKQINNNIIEQTKEYGESHTSNLINFQHAYPSAVLVGTNK